jgi:protein-tyrosine phosphatase
MIDSHCHVLFGIDDGPTTLEDSITMLKDAAADGVNKVICTSHCVPGMKFENEYSILKPVYDQVVEELKRQKIDLELYLACELMVTPLSLEWLKENRIASINQTQWLLVEIPYLSNVHFELDVEATFRTLISMGYKILIAHPERYREIQGNYANMAVWRSIGCKFQINRTSLLDTAREVERNLCWRFIEDDYCDVIATDAHRTSVRNIKLSDAYAMIETRFGSSRAQRLFTDNPQRLIDGLDLL